MELMYTNVNGYLIRNLTYKSGEQMEQQQVWFSSQRLSEKLSKFNLSDDAFGIPLESIFWSGQGSQRTGREVILKQLEKEPLPDKEKDQLPG